MKILRISLRNIASLKGNHTVDFSAEPLRTAGLFSITGPTGAGKSTLLDALCLALYEKTPRLNAVRGTVKLNDGAETISQKDCANLLTRGTGEGFAEVAFVGVDAGTYTARWSVRRARNRPEGALQNTEMSLLRGDVRAGTEGVVEQGGKKTEVLPVIAAKIGLSFDQFTRAVLLAQNDFATFLKADDKERAEILQALTGTGQFENISKAVFIRCSSEQRAVAEIEAKLEGRAPMSSELRAQAVSLFQQEEVALNELAAKLSTREQHAAWFTRAAALAESLKLAETRLQETRLHRLNAEPQRLKLEQTIEVSREARPLWETEQRTQSEIVVAEKAVIAAAAAEAGAKAEFESRKQEWEAATVGFDQARAALEATQPVLRQARDLDARLVPLADQLARASADLKAAQASLEQVVRGRDELIRKRQKLEQDQAQVQSRLTALAAYAPFAPHATAWTDRLDRAVAAQQGLVAAQSRVSAARKQEQTRRQAHAVEQAKEPQLRQLAGSTAEALAVAEQALGKFDSEKLAVHRRETESARDALRNLQIQLRDLADLSAQELAVKTEVAQLESQNEADGKTLVELREQLIPAAEVRALAARQAFELAQAAVADATISLRQKLQPYQACPVCGSLEHPYDSHSPTMEEAVVRALREDLEAKEKAIGALNQQEAGLLAACAARDQQKAIRLKTLTELSRRLIAARALNPEHLEARSVLDLPAEERVATLLQKLTIREKELLDLEAADTARRAAEKTRDRQRVAAEAAGQKLAELERILHGFAADLIKHQGDREAAEQAGQVAGQVAQSSEDELAPVFAALAHAAPSWKENPAGFRQNFEAALASHQTLEKQLATIVAGLNETAAALTPVEEGVTRAQADQTAKAAAASSCQASHQAVRLERAALFAGRAANEVEKELTQTLQRATQKREAGQALLGKAELKLAAASQERTGAGVRLAEMQQRRNAALAALDQWLTGFAARTSRVLDRAGLSVLLARDQAWITHERNLIQALEAAIQTATGALKVHQETLSAHLANRPTADEESAVTADIASLKVTHAETAQRRNEAQAALLADDQRRRECDDLARQLEARKALALPWERLNELIGSADGAKFRSIAQRRTLDVLLGYANAQLDLLSSRYRLERLPESLNLIVCDRDMGDERRSVHSLSGGECFLISLALALGLASLTSNRLRVESLFIDEGFGSLDSDTLNIAMSALMRLEAQGRKVGVISHVTEMAEAIPVQIRVIKGHSGTSRIQVPGYQPGESDLEAANTMVTATSAAASPTQPAADPQAIAAIASQILAILHREAAAGTAKVSTRSLRDEIGCSLPALTAARNTLAGQVMSEGKSLKLAAASLLQLELDPIKPND